MDKKELIEFLKDSLKVEIHKTYLCGDRARVKVCLNLVTDDEEIKIDSDTVIIYEKD